MTRRRGPRPKSDSNGSASTATLDKSQESDGCGDSLAESAIDEAATEVNTLALAQQIYVKILPSSPYSDGMSRTFEHMANVALTAAEEFAKAAEERGQP